MLGWGSIDEMLDTMTYKEYQEWVAFYSIEPFPEERQDFRNALLCTTLINLQRTKSSDPIAQIEDYMPDYYNERVSKKQSQQEIIQNARLISAMIGNKKKEEE